MLPAPGVVSELTFDTVNSTFWRVQVKARHLHGLPPWLRLPQGLGRFFASEIGAKTRFLGS